MIWPGPFTFQTNLAHLRNLISLHGLAQPVDLPTPEGWKAELAWAPWV